MARRSPRATRQFKKDWRRMVARGRDMDELRAVIQKIVAGEKLQPNRRPHPLRGQYADCMECQIGGDWLLIWRPSDDAITFVRTGTHDDLFG